MNNNRRQLLDDMFDAFTMLAEGNYVSLYDIKGHLTRYTPAAVEIFGLPSEYIEEGAFVWDNQVHPEDRARYKSVMRSLISCGKLTYDLSYRTKLRDGSYGLFRYVGAVIRDDDGSPSLVGGMIINEGIMENTDAVTVLRNKYGFFNDLTAMQITGQHCVILLIGIKRLSRINEEHGYGFGNKVLQQAGLQIQEIVGQGGIVYRMDGSKFAVMTKSLSQQAVVEIYKKIKQKLQGGISIEGTRQNLTISGGLYNVTDSSIESRTIYSCLKHVYNESKEKKHGALVIFNGNENLSGNKLSLIQRIHSDMIGRCEGFYVDYQPVYNLDKNQIIGVESFIRFKDKECGTIMPEDFMPVLEQDIAFEELGIWVMRKVMKDGKEFLNKYPNIMIGINIAPSQIEDEFFTDTVYSVAEQTGFPLKNLCLELTKDCRFLEIELLKKRTNELQSKGVRILIDDFGSGFSSLEILKDLKAEYIKFDMRFVNGIEENEADRLDLKYLSELAAIHGQIVCVKGVETNNTLNILKEFPISSVQGYLLAKPMSYEEFLKL